MLWHQILSREMELRGQEACFSCRANVVFSFICLFLTARLFHSSAVSLSCFFFFFLLDIKKKVFLLFCIKLHKTEDTELLSSFPIQCEMTENVQWLQKKSQTPYFPSTFSHWMLSGLTVMRPQLIRCRLQVEGGQPDKWDGPSSPWQKEMG